jgi:hypothetical protein
MYDPRPNKVAHKKLAPETPPVGHKLDYQAKIGKIHAYSIVHNNVTS